MVADPRSFDGFFGVNFMGSLVVTNYRVGFKSVSRRANRDYASVVEASGLGCAKNQFQPSLVQSQIDNFEWDLPLSSVQNYESNPHTLVDDTCDYLHDGPLVTIRFIGKNGQSINVLCEDCPATFRLLRFVNDKTFASEPTNTFAYAYGDKRLINSHSPPPKLPPRKGSVATHASASLADVESNIPVPPLPLRARSGWDLYNPVAEYKRLGFIQDVDSNQRLSGPVGWRLVNQLVEGRNKFWICKTYPPKYTPSATPHPSTCFTPA
jgi:hypothetical protein